MASISTLVATAVAAAKGWGGAAITDTTAMFAQMLRRLETDHLWVMEYEDFVRQVSFAVAGEEIHFADALRACRRLVELGVKM
jgi:hypothetical protein